MKRERVVTLEIESLAAGGAGIAKLDGQVVFVARAVPGDRVEAAIDAGTKPLRARVVRVVEASKDRVEPSCAHWEACGGCDWMHVSERAQLEGHAAIVRAAIARATGIEPPPIVTHAATKQLGYRTRARLFVRTSKNHVGVGYRAASSRDLVAIDRCVVLDPAIEIAVASLSSLFEGARGEGDVAIARGAEGKPVVDVAWRGELTAASWKTASRLVEERSWAGARITLEGTSAPASFGDPRPVLEGADGHPLVVAPGGFAQPSDEGAKALAIRANELARENLKAPAHVLELFAGSGTLSIVLAKECASFASVEIDRAAVDAARANFKARNLEGKLSVADADATSIPPKTEVVVLDPPRAGAAGATKAIAQSSVKTIVYVACDPATLARDLATLTRGPFVMTHVETFELFPQTSHAETIVRLQRARGGRS